MNVFFLSLSSVAGPIGGIGAIGAIGALGGSGALTGGGVLLGGTLLDPKKLAKSVLVGPLIGTVGWGCLFWAVLLFAGGTTGTGWTGPFAAWFPKKFEKSYILVPGCTTAGRDPCWLPAWGFWGDWSFLAGVLFGGGTGGVCCFWGGWEGCGTCLLGSVFFYGPLGLLFIVDLAVNS